MSDNYGVVLRRENQWIMLRFSHRHAATAFYLAAREGDLDAAELVALAVGEAPRTIEAWEGPSRRAKTT